MDWTRSDTIALASAACTLCHGDGMKKTPCKGKETPCNCVLRAIFRACYAKFRHCATKEKEVSKVTWQFCEGTMGSRRTWGRRDEEYVADFCLVSQRNLTEFENRIFRYHFLLGADWKLCCRQLKIDRGTFFHAVYRIQQKLGKVFRELEPYALFPLDEYFGGKIIKKLPASLSNVVFMPRPNERATLRPPLRKIA